jgi:Flp pilus assembly CpaE family ATPase
LRCSMDKNTFVLLVDETSSAIDAIRRALADRADQFRVQCVEDVSTALARIAGGGVDIVLMRLGPAASSEADLWDGFLKLQAGARKIPIVVVCDSADENLGERAVQKGAADYLIREAYDVDLLRVLDSTVGKTSHPLESSGAAPSPAKRSKVLAFMGAKGGAGTTTVALNVAAALAQNHSVILAELHPVLGTLTHYCQPHRSSQGIGHLMKLDRSAISTREVEACLWPCKEAPGLQLLFGPRDMKNLTAIEPEDARAVLAVLNTLADYVVIDLPVSLSETNRAVIEDADLLALVVERDPICVQSAKQILEAMDHWKAAAVVMGAVIVNRAGLVSPLPMPEIEAALSIPIFDSIPPAQDLCAASQHAHVPLVMFDAESLAAVSLGDLTKVISGYIPVMRRLEPVDAGERPTRDAWLKTNRVVAR